jgi:xanthine dehydrogenase small subunit
MIELTVDGRAVVVHDEDASLLDVVREQVGCRSVKDGCSPQGQCGCCTVLVDGAPRVSCVTPARRVHGRAITTTEGLDPAVAARWAAAFVDAGASQCGFCTPGIVLRLAALADRRAVVDEAAIRTALGAHLCRCTGWQSIVAAAARVLGTAGPAGDEPVQDAAVGAAPDRDPLFVQWRAQLEGPAFQVSDAAVVLGAGGFADDTAPVGALVALADADGAYAVGGDLPAARRQSAKVQGRRSTLGLRHPLAVPDGDWAVRLATTWVEPAYLEPDASWCLPGGRAASPLANGGAFGGKRASPVGDEARRLADEHDRAVRALWSRERVVRAGPKRPPVAAGVRADGTGVLRVATTPGAADLQPWVARVAETAPGLEVEVVTVDGPPVAPWLRATGWAEAAVLLAGARCAAAGTVGPGTPVEVTSPAGGRARVVVAADGSVEAAVWAGEALDPVTLRSYCFGAIHQALGWVWSEGLSVDDAGVVQDLTIRSFGILTARETPEMDVVLHSDDTWPVNGSDAVFAATAAAAWVAGGLAPTWPTGRPERTAR